jgi:hypothetical protein
VAVYRVTFQLPDRPETVVSAGDDEYLLDGGLSID